MSLNKNDAQDCNERHEINEKDIFPEYEQDSFSELVEKCSKKELKQEIYNASKKHALVLFIYLLKKALQKTESVKLISGNLSIDFYDKLAPAIEAVMSKGSEVDVIVLDGNINLEDHAFAKAVKEHPRGNLVQAPKNESIDGTHFLLVGDRRFRWESDHEQSKAEANFHDKDNGAFLAKLFDIYKRVITSGPSPQAATP